MNTDLKTLQKELHEIIGKLETVAESVRENFVGIGSEYCAESLNDVAKEYRKLEKRLQVAINVTNMEL